jgi:hypothetical protein
MLFSLLHLVLTATFANRVARGAKLVSDGDRWPTR